MATWTFEQIEGRPVSSRRKLELEGWNAPHGRPRRDPVIREVIKSRIQTTRYPGSSVQTRHAFGTNWETTELKGRWMTKAGGKLASELADDWTMFVRDERTCRISWGFIVSYTGYISELELARESDHQIAWRMKIEIDSRNDLPLEPRPPIPLFTPPAENLADISNWMAFSKKLKAPTLPDLNPTFLESLDNLAAALNTPAAELNKLAGKLDDIEKATFSTIQHFRGAVTGFRTALVAMRDTVLNTAADSVTVVRTAESDIAWVKYQADFDNQSAYMMDRLNQLDRQAELAQRNEVSKVITAEDGDTWESISSRATGSPDKASEIRALNGIRYGAKPEAGEFYLVP